MKADFFSSLLGIVLLRPSGLGFLSALNLSAIELDEDRIVHGFSSQRNSGWSVRAMGDIIPPIIVTAETSPRDITKHLASDNEYRKQRRDDIRRMREFDNIDDNNIEETDSLGFIDTSIDYENTIMSKELSEENLENKTPDELLVLALKWSSLEVFCEALAAGADANLVLNGFEDPIVFALARDGKTDWVAALIETGRCDVTRLDQNGMAAGYYPGVMAREFAAQKSAPEEVWRFGQIATGLREERSRQLAADLGNSPAP